ncbi:uncharacterized protein SCHCODRAFT_02685727 [Schizophyllum commune H4-8]|nr:uncharacterized protein SCHCODRAFT_02685727 [Schizophyllum commune H4-8]KAI5896809.1 hypothetical protein SCHCODRAFT_02685727 [Schizophyllum commune H4-8]
MYFVRRIILNYLDEHGATLLQEFEKALHEDPSSHQISLGLYFVDTIVPTTTVKCANYFDLPEDVLQDDILIHVSVWMTAALDIDTTSAVIRLMLLKLSDLRLAVEHKRSLAALEVLCL